VVMTATARAIGVEFNSLIRRLDPDARTSAERMDWVRSSTWKAGVDARFRRMLRWTERVTVCSRTRVSGYVLVRLVKASEVGETGIKRSALMAREGMPGRPSHGDRGIVSTKGSRLGRRA